MALYEVHRELIEKAVKKGYVDILEVLLSSYDYTKISLNPYLEIAAKDGKIKIVKVLVSHGAKVTKKTIQLAKESGHKGTATYLMKAMKRK